MVVRMRRPKGRADVAPNPGGDVRPLPIRFEIEIEIIEIEIELRVMSVSSCKNEAA
jgi:hypothetical protein